MAVEIEAKMAVESLDAVRDALRRLKAAPAGNTFETNVFLDRPDRSLLAGDEGLRLRRNRNVETGEDVHVITYKGKRQAGPLKSREEVELTVADFGDGIRLLEKVGFERTLTFEKRRESWTLDDCKIELDELPHLGFYVEIEGPSEQSVFSVRERLGLAQQAMEKSSYAAMLTAFVERQGGLRRDVTFADAGHR